MIQGRIILKGKIELKSPLLIGSGEDNSTDMDVLVDENGQPYIPATSFFGILRHHLSDGNYKFSLKEKDALEDIFGFSEEEKSKGSSFICSDLFLDVPENKIVVRDGIKINNKTGIVEKGAKFDYQVIEKGARFNLNIEAEYTDNGSKETVKKLLLTIKDSLTVGDIRIGAKTNNGLGKITLLDDYKIFDYDFSDIDNVIAWLLTNDITPLVIKETDKGFLPSKNVFLIDAYFKLKTSLIQRSYTDEPSAPDSVHIQSKGENVLTGSGTKGAIRARAVRILNTLNENDEARTREIIDELFGAVKKSKNSSDNDGDSSKNKKGNLLIEENKISAVVAAIQSRIKIDRFTGGTIKAALFDSMPLFSDSEEINLNDKAIRITMEIKKYEDYEAGLMLLILKDIWTGDLAIGGEKGIGRGVFEGMSADITGKDISLTITNDNLQLEQLQKKYVDCLINKTAANPVEVENESK
ncbi:MAG: hypothetical protein IH949_09790 [Bacteroidetes bacterium]|nr:hypothetical protein [Bacteroidota bacterium]